MVSERFASEFGSPTAALGHKVTIGNAPPWRFVAVVKGMGYMTAGANRNEIYIPAHAPFGFLSTFVARINGHAEDRPAMIREPVRSVDPQVPIFGVEPWSSGCPTHSPDRTSTGPRFFRFAAIALLLVVIGIYGIVSYTVARRRRKWVCA